MHNYLSSAVLLLLLQWQTAVLFLFVRSVQSSGKCRNLKLSLLRKIHTRTPGAIFVGHSMPSDPQNNDYYGHFALFTLSDAEFFALHAPTNVWKCKGCAQNFAIGDRILTYHGFFKGIAENFKSLHAFVNLHFSHLACGLLETQNGCSLCNGAAYIGKTLLAFRLTLSELQTFVASPQLLSKLDVSTKSIMQDAAFKFVKQTSKNDPEAKNYLTPMQFLKIFRIFVGEGATKSSICPAYEDFFFRNIAEDNVNDQLMILAAHFIDKDAKMALTYLTTLSIEYLDRYAYRKRGLNLLDSIQEDEEVRTASLYSRIMLSATLVNLLVDADKADVAVPFVTDSITAYVAAVNVNSAAEMMALQQLLLPIFAEFSDAASTFGLDRCPFIRLGDDFWQKLCHMFIFSAFNYQENFYFLLNCIADKSVKAAVMADAVTIHISEQSVDEFLAENIGLESVIRAFLLKAIGNEKSRRLFQKYYNAVMPRLSDEDRLKLARECQPRQIPQCSISECIDDDEKEEEESSDE